MTKELKPSISIDYRSKTIILNESGWNIKFMMEDTDMIEQLGNQNLQPQQVIKNMDLFMEVFESLSNPDDADVPRGLLCDHLFSRFELTDKEAKKLIEIAMQNGLIYERRKGWYAKA